MPADFRFFPNEAELPEESHSCHLNFVCGACAKPTNGRCLASITRADKCEIHVCVCSCGQFEPTIIVDQPGATLRQIPEPKEFHAGQQWPPDLAKLFEEAAIAFTAAAYTAAAMVARKLLMACACHEGDQDGKSFAQYVDYITNKVLVFPKAKAAIDQIRNIGNDASHSIQFVAKDDAKRAMAIVKYMLDTIYSLPSA